MRCHAFFRFSSIKHELLWLSRVALGIVGGALTIVDTCLK